MSEPMIPQSVRPNPGEFVESIGEQLSALVDGELARDQVRFLLRGVEAESDLARRWSGYHLISATLKRQTVAFTLPVDFADRVIGRLDAQSSLVVAASARRGVGALRWVGGGAIAAAVAVVALVVSRPVGDNPTPASTPQGTVLAQQASVRNTQSSVPASPAQIANPLPLSTFNSNSVMPAIYESGRTDFYSPRGDTFTRNELPAGTVPYIFAISPLRQPVAVVPRTAPTPAQ